MSLRVQANNYDAVFLDIMMPGINGMDVAQEIRQWNRFVPIIFMSSSKDFAATGYNFFAIDYLVKPLKKENVRTAVGKIHLMHRAGEETCIIETGDEVVRIPTNSLIYAESQGKRTIVHTTRGSFECLRTLSAIHQKDEGLIWLIVTAAHYVYLLSTLFIIRRLPKGTFSYIAFSEGLVLLMVPMLSAVTAYMLSSI